LPNHLGPLLMHHGIGPGVTPIPRFPKHRDRPSRANMQVKALQQALKLASPLLGEDQNPGL
jgi:hypothetical protein